MSGGLLLALLAFGALYLGAFGRWLIRIDPKVNFWLAVIGIVTALGAVSGGDETTSTNRTTPVSTQSQWLYPSTSQAAPSPTVPRRIPMPPRDTLPVTPRLTLPPPITAQSSTVTVLRSLDGTFAQPSLCHRFTRLVGIDKAEFVKIC